MAAVHEKNALRLRAIMAQIGWPRERLVGKRAADAAWLIAQHAIAHPEFQRSCLKLLAAAALEHLVPAWQPAMNGSSTTIRSGSLRSVGAHAPSRRVRGQHEVAAERYVARPRRSPNAHHVDPGIDRCSRYRRVSGPRCDVGTTAGRGSQIESRRSSTDWGVFRAMRS